MSGPPGAGLPPHLVKAFVEHLDVRYGGRTMETYLWHVRIFEKWVIERGLSLAEMRTADLKAYQTDLLVQRKADGGPYSTGYQMLRLASIRSFFRFLYRTGAILTDPATGIEMPRKDDRLPRAILTQAEVFRMLAGPSGRSPVELRDRAVMETLYATGIRCGELRNLRPYDISCEERTLRVVQGKGRRDRILPLTQAAAKAITEYLRRGRPKLVGAMRSPVLFLSSRGGKTLCGQGVCRIVKCWAQAARIKKPVSPHTFRHTVATHLLRGRADIRHIQRLLGHRHLQTTERYTRVELTDLRDVLRRAHPRGR